METNFKPYKHLVLNIPHASDNILEELMPKNPPFRTMAAYRDYQKNSRPLIDWYTDELFSVDNDQRITPIVATICRTLCDVERMINDPLEAKGYGIVCTKMHHYTAFPITSSVMDFIPYRIPLYQYYLDYHYRLAKAILTNSHDFSYFHPCPVLLIDCHSFSSMPTALCDPGPQEEQVDICLGYNDDATCPPQELIDFVASYFENLGYRVGRNTPFSHSKTVECPVPYHSLMIEVNKRCYMNEQTLEKTKGFVRLRYEIEGLYSHILKDGGYRILF
jgi:N-formylglutamate amidohydrolase